MTRNATVLKIAPSVMQSMNHLARVFLRLSFGFSSLSSLRFSGPNSMSLSEPLFVLVGYAGKVRSRSCCHLKFGGAVSKESRTNRKRSYSLKLVKMDFCGVAHIS